MEKEMSFDDTINITSGQSILRGSLVIPENSHALIIFVDDQGKGQHDPRNLHFAEILQRERFATLLVDLLTSDEIANQPHTLDISYLAGRISDVCKWAAQNPQTEQLNVGLFGYNTGIAAVLKAASYQESKINAIVSLGGRPDLVLDVLEKIHVPLLLIVGHVDNAIVTFNQKALPHIHAESRMEVLQDSGKGFQEPAVQEKIASLSKEWFTRHM
jgi:putative phosphoribosyl transferase